MAMETAEVETRLDEAEAAIREERPFDRPRFWATVAAVKTAPDLADRFADQIGRIDRASFRRWAPIALPLWLGTVLAIGATLIGLVVACWALRLDSPFSGLVFLLGFGIVLVSTHGLAHLGVGMALGMRFTHWFVAGVSRPQPGVKLDYATYLRARPSARAWMHASGAIVTKLVPFVFAVVALASSLPGWVALLLFALGVIQVVTDVVWSTRASDWKKFNRERRFSQFGS
jgi:hypothetical protein